MADNTASFVRDQLIPESLPPSSETGAIKWVRENLFSSPLNIFMTVVSLWAIYSLIINVAPWFINGVWSGSSVRDCYEVLDGATGACFAVLKERWPQLIYGFKYPASEFWRPNLAAILLYCHRAGIVSHRFKKIVFLYFDISISGVLAGLGRHNSDLDRRLRRLPCGSIVLS
jgi:general L-amino acid transport system permease protein